MLHQNIGEILSSRYKIVQNLGYGLFGQNYLAEDLKTPLHTECIIKCLESAESSHLDTTRLRFATEVKILQRLETHKGIPKIIAAFEENNQFYLVQELISGHSLTDELPINENWGNLWNESKVVKFLQEVLGILETVHFHGIVHCDLKPDNLIRRAEDGKLFITDFGSLGLSQFEINSFASIPIENTALGYTPPEQFSRQMHPSMDIYALGMIAIQGMTRLSPMQLQQDQETNNVIWHFNKMEVSEQIAAILSKMVCYDFRKRYQSAGEVLQALQNLCIEVAYAEVETSSYRDQILDWVPRESRPAINSNLHNEELITQEYSHSPKLTGIKISLAANTLVIGFGAYLLLNNSTASSQKATLYKATEQYQTGNIDKAIALAKSIPSNSSVYPEAETTIKDWHQEWKFATQQFQVTEKAFNQSRWADVLIASRQVPDILYWQTKTNYLVKKAKIKIEVVTQTLLNKAYSSADAKDFSTALSYLQQIPPESSIALVVKEKLAEYSRKQEVKAVYLLQLAYNQAESKEFTKAIRIIKQIPKATDTYATAQLKLAEYTEKHRQHLQIAKSGLKSDIYRRDTTHLQSVNIRYQTANLG